MNYREIKQRLKADGAAKTCQHVKEALEQGHLKADDFTSFRGLFEATVPDGREALEYYHPRHRGSFGYQEAGDAIDTSVFSNISGQVVYNKILEASKSPQLVLSQLIKSIPSNLRSERIAGITGLGDAAESIAEGAEYPRAGVGEDYVDTPLTDKKGFTVAVTKEAVLFDRVGDVLNQAARVGEFLAINKEKRLADMIGDVNSTKHRYKWKGTSYANYASSGGHGAVNLKTSNGLVDWTDIDNALQLLNNMLDPWTGEPMLLMANTILVCPELEATAKRILNATEIRFHDGASQTSQTLSANPVAGAYGLVSSTFLRSRLSAASEATTNWYLGDFSKAFGYMENWPITVVQAPSNSHNDFHRDIVAEYKASEMGAAVVLEPRAVIKNTVA